LIFQKPLISDLDEGKNIRTTPCHPSIFEEKNMNKNMTKHLQPFPETQKTIRPRL